MQPAGAPTYAMRRTQRAPSVWPASSTAAGSPRIRPSSCTPSSIAWPGPRGPAPARRRQSMAARSTEDTARGLEPVASEGRASGTRGVPDRGRRPERRSRHRRWRDLRVPRRHSPYSAITIHRAPGSSPAGIEQPIHRELSQRRCSGLRRLGRASASAGSSGTRGLATPSADGRSALRRAHRSWSRRSFANGRLVHAPSMRGASGAFDRGRDQVQRLRNQIGLGPRQRGVSRA
jgi:hypothetical protein